MLRPYRQPCRSGLFVRVIAGANQGAGFDVAEAHLKGFGLQLGELAWRVEPGHGQVVARRAQILADGQDVAMDGGQVAEDLSSSEVSSPRPTITPDLVIPAG